MAMNEPTPKRVSHRVVTMRDLTPNGAGYLMSGDTQAEVEVNDTGVKIRAKGQRQWRFVSWAEVWINATG